jgi:Ca-activated chloride channel family protein
VTFATPLALVGLVLVPLLVAGYVVHERRRERYAARFATPALLPNVVDRAPGWRRHLPVAILLVALAAMIVGVARPHASVTVKREEATIVLAIDTSRSMKAADVKPTRLSAARRAAKAFLRKIPAKYRVGVVSFGTRASTAVPPTRNRSLVKRALNSLRPGEGTALGDGVVLGVHLGRQQRGKGGVVPPESILLISDGARDGGRTSPKDASKKAKRAHVPVYTVLVGTQEGTITETLTGGFRQIVHVPPSPSTLEQVADATGGRMFKATNDSRLRSVYERLGSRLGHRKQNREVSDVFAGGSAGLLLLGGALSMLWFRRVP